MITVLRHHGGARFAGGSATDDHIVNAYYSNLAGGHCAAKRLICYTPIGVEARGDLAFQFVDDYALYGHVFSATDCEGEPRETDEAIAFDRMWADDRLWFPHLLRGEYFRGRFLFDGDALLECEIAFPPF